MNTKPVDVLALLDRELVRRAEDRLVFARQHSPALVPLCEQIAAHCREARDAIAELIAAVEEWEENRGDADADCGSVAYVRYGQVCERVDAALARVKGEA